MISKMIRNVIKSIVLKENFDVKISSKTVEVLGLQNLIEIDL